MATRKRVRSSPIKSLVIAVIGDGSLYAASSHPNASDPRYWLQLRLDREPFVLYEARRVPALTADRLETQGLSDQWYDDGYTAMNAVAPYIHGRPFYVSHDYDPETGYIYNSEAEDEDNDNPNAAVRYR